MNKERILDFSIQDKEIKAKLIISDDIAIQVSINGGYPIYVDLDIYKRMCLLITSDISSSLWNVFRPGEDILSAAKKYPLLRKVIYPNARFIARFIVKIVQEEICNIFGITKEQYRQISAIAFKSYHPRSRRNSRHFEFMYCIIPKRFFSDKEYQMFLDDLTKYKATTIQWLLREMWNIKRDKLELNFNSYLEILNRIPNIIKKFNYGFMINDLNFVKKHNFNPQNRFQYFLLAAISSLNINWSDKYIEKLKNMNIKSWHYFKEYMHIKRPYSIMELKHLLTTLLDGERLHIQNKINRFGIDFTPIEGSPLRMIKNAIFNHRQEQKLRKEELLSSPNRLMANPPCSLPEWIENIRLKDTHSMIRAGLECHHCIGSYSESIDIFVRKDDICAQISRNNLRVVQCYDVNDQITTESKRLEKRLNEELEKLNMTNQLERSKIC